MTQSELIAEAAMESFWGHYVVGDFDAGIALLKGFGYRQNAVEFTLDPDNYYIPNRRGDRYVRPSTISEEKIPVFALEAGRQVEFEPPSLHYLQHIALLAAGYSGDHVAQVKSQFSKLDTKVSSNSGQSGTASVYRRTTAPAAHGGKHVESRPALIFNLGEGNMDSFEEPLEGVTLHELTHIAQTLSDPFRPETEEELLQEELEAYAVQATTITSWNVPYSLSNARAGEVDDFRQRYLGADDFKPTPEFMQQFRASPSFARIMTGIARNVG